MNPPEPAPPLPPDLESLIARTIKRARLRRPERDDVARELRSHFAEALAVGTPIEDVVGGFGDPDAAGRLIGRAKRRCRGFVWHAWVWSCRGVAALFALVLITYGWAAMQYYRPSRVQIGPNENELFEAMGMPEEGAGDAWRSYRAFRQSIPPEMKTKNPLPSNDDEWAGLAATLKHMRPKIDAMQSAFESPRLGYTLVDWRADNRDTPSSTTPFMLQKWEFANDLTAVFHWLRRDLWHSVDSDDIERAVLTSERMAHLGRHLNAIAIHICQLIDTSLAMAVAEWILAETAGRGVGTLHPRTDRLAQVLDAFWHQLSEWPLEGEHFCVEDVLHRLYGGGSGRERITASGWSTTLGASAYESSLSSTWWRPEQIMDTPLAPIATFLLPTLKESVAHARSVMNQEKRYLDTPLWISFEEEWHTTQLIASDRPTAVYSLYPSAAVISTFAHARGRRSVALMLVDAARAALAISEYQRDHGGPPPSLEALVPKYMPRPPIDQFTGDPMRYRITSVGPVLYSLGVDRDDDNGTPIVNEKGLISVPWPIDPGDWASRDADDQARMNGDWILWPPINPDTGAFIFTPPAD